MAREYRSYITDQGWEVSAKDIVIVHQKVEWRENGGAWEIVPGGAYDEILPAPQVIAIMDMPIPDAEKQQMLKELMQTTVMARGLVESNEAKIGLDELLPTPPFGIPLPLPE